MDVIVTCVRCSREIPRSEAYLDCTGRNESYYLSQHTIDVFNAHKERYPNYRIRKLTPRECFRLMGVSDADIDKIQVAGISKSQQYKMAGNSIVVNCLAAIFRQLFIGNFNKVVQTEIF